MKPVKANLTPYLYDTSNVDKEKQSKGQSKLAALVVSCTCLFAMHNRTINPLSSVDWHTQNLRTGSIVASLDFGRALIFRLSVSRNFIACYWFVSLIGTRE
jgi:hypothetical protein